MTTHTLRLDLVNRVGCVEVDGHDVSSSIRSLRLDASADHSPRVTLDLVIHAIHSNVADTAVTIPDTTARLLMALGWTPPATDTE
ncbi:hypothetical protein GTY23_41535 [Streptomyces sp. SID5998]|nr:hypothetical protein [Streptomyces sp. SID5998]